MKIAIDARMYGLEHAGIGRYVMNLIHQIEKLSAKGGPAKGRDKENDYFIFLRKKYFRDLRFKNRRFKKILADHPHYSFQEQILLPLQLIKLRPDLVHFPHFNVPILWWGRQIVTIHDLIKHESKGLETTTRWQPLYWLKYLVYKFIVWLAVKRAAKIIVPSKWWKKELVRRYALGPDKIVVTYEGVDEKFHQPPTANHKSPKILEKYKITKPYVIYAGSLYPHKNVERLVEAVVRLRLSLVIVCVRSVFLDRFKQKIKKLKAEKFVNLVGFVSDEELVVLYSQAEAFVFPSLLEGFGLPGLEAMAADCPVVCSNIPVLREVYGEAAEYFNPLDVKDMTKKIKLVIKDDERKQKLKKLGLELVKKYSWKKMAKETLSVYQEAMKS